MPTFFGTAKVIRAIFLLPIVVSDICVSAASTRGGAMVALKKQRLPELRNISTIYSRPFAECCFSLAVEILEFIPITEWFERRCSSRLVRIIDFWSFGNRR